MKHWIIALALGSIATTATAQTEVLTGVMHGKDYGVTYMLPKTVFEIEIQARQIISKPGEFSAYAERYLRTKPVATVQETRWEVSNIKVKSAGIPNPDNTYFVKLKDKTTAPLMELTEAGVVVSINAPRLAPRSEVPSSQAKPETPSVDPRMFLTEEMLTATSNAKLADLVAKEIYNIRESKNALLRGQADNTPSDGEQLKLMINNLDRQEKAFTELFLGTQTVKEQTFTVRVAPETDGNRRVAFRFSDRLGLVEADDLAGAPYYLTATDLQRIPPQPEEDRKRKATEGIAYNLPGQALVSLTDGKREWFKAELPVTQLGHVEYLAPVLFNRNSAIKVYFDENTGALLKIEREEIVK